MERFVFYSGTVRAYNGHSGSFTAESAKDAEQIMVDIVQLVFASKAKQSHCKTRLLRKQRSPRRTG